jgi:hypothetical protein
MVIDTHNKETYHDVSLRFTTKAKAWKGVSWECNSKITFTLPNVTTLILGAWPSKGMERCEPGVQPESHIHHLRSAGECEGMNPHTPNGHPTLGIGILMDSQIFKEQFEGQNSLDYKIHFTIENLLRCRCLKWGPIIHLNTYNRSYRRKKGWESKCQFDS